LKLRHTFESLDMEDVLLQDSRVMHFRKNHPINTWTIESENQLQNALPLTDTVTFQKIDGEHVKKLLSH
jgi:hypothetical protein